MGHGIDLIKRPGTSIEPAKFECIISSQLNIVPTQLGLLELSIKATPIHHSEGERYGWLQVQWSALNENRVVSQGVLTQALIIDGQGRKYMFNLGEHKAWLLGGLIKQMRPAQCRVDINWKLKK